MVGMTGTMVEEPRSTVQQTKKEKGLGLQFVLIHGGWHHGGHWKEVQRALEERGHSAYAPTLLGNEPNADRINYPLDDIVHQLREDIVSRNLTNIILVGHSSGGYMVQQIAQLEPQRVKRVIFVNAHLLFDGESLLAIVNPSADETPNADNNYNFPLREVPFYVWRTLLTHSVDSETSKALYETLVQQGGQAYSEAQDVKKFFELCIPKAYVHLTDDIAFEALWNQLYSSRVAQDFRVVEMAGDHEALLTCPVRLAEKLIEASSDEERRQESKRWKKVSGRVIHKSKSLCSLPLAFILHVFRNYRRLN